MPKPVLASTDPAMCSVSDDATAEELDARMSLSAAHPATASSQNAQAAASAPPSPAVSALVARFSAPAGARPPVEPSLGQALLNCKVATAGYLANTAGVLLTAPETFGVALVVGVARIAASGAALLSCIEQEEARQVEAANRANQAADCRSAGALPLITADGSVLCEKEP